MEERLSLEYISDKTKKGLMDHYSSFPIDLRQLIKYNAENWIRETIIEKEKRQCKIHHCCPFISVIPADMLIMVEMDEDADICNTYAKIQYHILRQLDLDPSTDKLRMSRVRSQFLELVDAQSCTKESIQSFYSSIYTFMRNHRDILSEETVSFILDTILPYKLESFSIYMEVMGGVRVADDTIWDYTKNYFSLLLRWILGLYDKIKTSYAGLNLNSISDIAIGIYLFLQELNMDPTIYDLPFLLYMNEQSIRDYVHKKIVEISKNNTDFLVTLDNIHDRSGFTEYFTKVAKKRMTELLTTDRISEENGNETLIFGENILEGTNMSVRSLVDTLQMMTVDYVESYISNLNIGHIKFNISDHNKMYLRDSIGIKTLDVITKNATKIVARYDEDDKFALFLLFEPSTIQTEKIYGLSLDVDMGNRGLLILEKDKSDDTTYQLLFKGEN